MQETIRATVQLPMHIYQLAEQHQLGQFHVLYRRRFHRFLLWFLPGWLALVIITLGYDGYIEGQMDRRLIERTIEIASQSQAFGPRPLRAALDSSPLWGAG